MLGGWKAKMLGGWEAGRLGGWRNAKCQSSNDKAPKAQAEGIRHKAQGAFSSFWLLSTDY